MSADSRPADEAAIRAVLAAYAVGVDSGDLDMVAGCYFDDARERRGDFEGSVPEFLAWLADALAAFESTWHLLGVPLIGFDGDGDGADVETHCLGHHRLRAPGDGESRDRLIPCRYVDRFACRDGEWRILRRTVVYGPVLDVAGGPPLR